ncbi:MAG TPA: hypothetical protein VJX74_15245 [Blastocatellia bacterium]|nr:hypothetical protein [Blastocatellia bacterium]
MRFESLGQAIINSRIYLHPVALGAAYLQAELEGQARGLWFMHFRCAAKSAAYHLSIAGRAVLALVLAIGASSVIFSGGGLRSIPFFADDAQIENSDAATDRADSVDTGLQKSNESTDANSRPDPRKSDYNGKARLRRAKSIMLSANRQLQSEQDDFDNTAEGFLIPGGLNSW